MYYTRNTRKVVEGYFEYRNIVKFHRAPLAEAAGCWILKIRPLYTFALTSVSHAAHGDGDSSRLVITDGGEE